MIHEHRRIAEWAAELAAELSTARARLQCLAEAIDMASRLMEPPARASARAAVRAQTRALPAAGTRAAAIAAFLRSRETIFSPTDLAAWLKSAGHPVPASRDAARLLHRAERRGQVRRLCRGRYQAVL